MSPNSHQNESTGALGAPRLTWAVLLGQWLEFAKSALALSDDETGRRLRCSVPDIIMLQAVWFALQHLNKLDAEQLAVGLDRAEVLIEKHQGILRQRFADAMPTQVRTLIDDATRQLDCAQSNVRGNETAFDNNEP